MVPSPGGRQESLKDVSGLPRSMQGEVVSRVKGLSSFPENNGFLKVFPPPGQAPSKQE
jgi:hypothetical protein